MLNYIWAGLILFSLVFALFYDLRDLSQDTFRNGQALPVEIDFEDRTFDPDADRQPVTVRIDPAEFAAFYGTDAAPDSAYAAQLRTTDDGLEVRLEPDAALPAPLDQIRDLTNPRDKALQGALVGGTVAAGATVVTGGLTFASVRFVKMQAISAAALDFAEVAAEIALGLIGILVLFLGLTRIAEDAGIINALVKLVRPFLKPLFPDIPDGHPAMGMIALNLAANVFGLGNAATPFGIKAMEELQELNPEAETATDSMVMLLAMNTASVQLVPPVLLIAIIGLEINKVYFAIVLTTTASLTVAIIATKLLGRLKRYRDTDPMRLATDVPPLPPDASSSDASSEVR